MNRVNPGAEKISAQSELLYNRLVKRYRHLKKWARRTGINSYRLYDRDIPEIPLVLDLYDDAASLALYKPRLENEPPEETQAWLSEMRSAASRALNINEAHIFIKERRQMRNRQERPSQYGRISEKRFYRDAVEGDLLFRVNLSDYLDTGLFLDTRKKRTLIRSEAGRKRVLNLFAYTCTLSVAAAKGGALKVDSVDLSNTYLEWGKVNFALNKIGENARFNFIQSDVMKFLSQAEKKKLHWDLIILDPPSFSNSKKAVKTLDIKRDHGELIKCCLSLLEAGGTLFFSSSAKGFSLDNSDFPGYQLVDMRKLLADEDFRFKRVPYNVKFILPSCPL